MTDLLDTSEAGKMLALNPWGRIMRAYRADRGVRLNAAEVNLLGQDDAIETRANVMEMTAEERARYDVPDFTFRVATQP